MPKSVFISYRRDGGSHIARSIYSDLRDRGCEVYLDVETQGPGRFDEDLFRQIESRDNFLLILTPSTLSRVTDQGDWLRGEIEHAIECKRNIVPLFFDNFTFNDNLNHLIGKLGELRYYNGFRVPDELFSEAMTRIYRDFLKPVGDQEKQVKVQQTLTAPTTNVLIGVDNQQVAERPIGFTTQFPSSPTEVQQWFLPISESALQAAATWEKNCNERVIDFVSQGIAYKPVLIAQALVDYSWPNINMSTVLAYAFHVDLSIKDSPIAWSNYVGKPVKLQEMNYPPIPGAVFAEVETEYSIFQQAARLSTEIIDFLYNTSFLSVPINEELGLYGKPGENIEIFRAEAITVARMQRDREIDKVTAEIEAKLDMLDEENIQVYEKLVRLRSISISSKHKIFRPITFLISWLLSNDQSLYSNMISELEIKSENLMKQFEDQLKSINDTWARKAVQIVDYQAELKRENITLELFGLGWVPYWYVNINGHRQWLSEYR